MGVAGLVETKILSDEGLKKNNYLFRSIQKGWVSIRFIKGLKTKILPNSNDIALALFGESSDFEVSRDGKYVRRLKPFGPELLDYMNAKQKDSIIIINLPELYDNNRDFLRSVLTFNELTPIEIDIFTRQVPISAKNFTRIIPDLGRSLCAIVKYENEEKAKRAAGMISERKSVNGLTAAHLGKNVRKNLYRPKVDCCSLSATSSSDESKESGRGSIYREYQRSIVGTRVQQKVLIN